MFGKQPRRYKPFRTSNGWKIATSAMLEMGAVNSAEGAFRFPMALWHRTGPQQCPDKITALRSDQILRPNGPSARLACMQARALVPKKANVSCRPDRYAASPGADSSPYTRIQNRANQSGGHTDFTGPCGPTHRVEPSRIPCRTVSDRVGPCLAVTVPVPLRAHLVQTTGR